jgi:serine protease Do
MNRIIPAGPGRKPFPARRLALLASAAGLAIAVVAVGTSGFNTPNLPSAIAAAHAETIQRSAGFADVVEKVTPAVIFLSNLATAAKNSSSSLAAAVCQRDSRRASAP